MPRTNRPSVKLETLIRTLEECIDEGMKLTVEVKKAWVKVTGPQGQKVYISKTPDVRQVDLSGFAEKELPDDVPAVPATRYNGAVVAQLDLSVGDEKTAESLKKLAGLMQDMSPAQTRRGRQARQINLGRFAPPSLEQS